MTNIQQLRTAVDALQTAYDTKRAECQADIEYGRRIAAGLGEPYTGSTDPIQYRDHHGRSILLDALTTLVHAHAVLAQAEPELGHYLIEFQPETAAAAAEAGESPEEYTYRALDRRMEEDQRLTHWQPGTGPEVIHETWSHFGQPIRLRRSFAADGTAKAVAWLSTNPTSSGTHMTREECLTLAAALQEIAYEPKATS